MACSSKVTRRPFVKLMDRIDECAEEEWKVSVL